MNEYKALKLALAILQPFKEAGSIYNDYKADEGVTDEQYDDMLQVLANMLGRRRREQQRLDHPTQELLLWCRLGDMDDYDSYENVEAVAEFLAEAGVQGPISQCLHGLTAPGYEGNNFISLYWGDQRGNLVGDLDPEDFDLLVALMRRSESNDHED